MCLSIYASLHHWLLAPSPVLHCFTPSWFLPSPDFTSVAGLQLHLVPVAPSPTNIHPSISHDLCSWRQMKRKAVRGWPREFQFWLLRPATATAGTGGGQRQAHAEKFIRSSLTEEMGCHKLIFWKSASLTSSHTHLGDKRLTVYVIEYRLPITDHLHSMLLTVQYFQ